MWGMMRGLSLVRMGAEKALTVLLVIGLVFLLIHMVPGDPVAALLGDRASPVDREALRAALGLDKPLWSQYVHFVAGVFQGNWGTSMLSNKPVLGLMAERLPATLQLAAAAMAVALGLGGAMGAASVWGPRWTRALFNTASLAFMATPSFVLGPLLVVGLAVGTGVFPISGKAGPLSLVLPALTLGAGMAAVVARMLAASLQDEARKDYIRTIRAKGGGLWRIRAHILRNALLPVVQIVFLQLGMVLTGTVLTEAVFSWPGLGNLLVESLHQRDYPLIQGCLLLISLTYMVCVALADAASALLDPRIRTGGRG